MTVTELLKNRIAVMASSLNNGSGFTNTRIPYAQSDGTLGETADFVLAASNVLTLNNGSLSLTGTTATITSAGACQALSFNNTNSTFSASSAGAISCASLNAGSGSISTSGSGSFGAISGSSLNVTGACQAQSFNNSNSSFTVSSAGAVVGASLSASGVGNITAAGGAVIGNTFNNTGATFQVDASGNLTALINASHITSGTINIARLSGITGANIASNTIASSNLTNVVASGTYSSVTVDTAGRVTSGTVTPAGAVAPIVKSVMTDVTATGTPVTVSDLTLAIGASESWYFRFVIFSTASTGNVAIAFDQAFAGWRFTQTSFTPTGLTSSINVSGTNTTQTVITTVTYEGYIQNSGTAGNLTIAITNGTIAAQSTLFACKQ